MGQPLSFLVIRVLIKDKDLKNIAIAPDFSYLVANITKFIFLEKQ